MDSLISVCKCEHPPLWSNTLPENENMNDFIPKFVREIRSQDLPQYYRLNGTIFIAKTESLLTHKSFLTPQTIAYKMDNLYSSDIDSALDFTFAEFLASHIRDINGGGDTQLKPKILYILPTPFITALSHRTFLSTLEIDSPKAVSMEAA